MTVWTPAALAELKQYQEEARRIYYRVTGHPFNSVPPPTVRTARGQALDFSPWTWDPEQGGEQVGGRLSGLTLADSRMSGALTSGLRWFSGVTSLSELG